MALIERPQSCLITLYLHSPDSFLIDSILLLYQLKTFVHFSDSVRGVQNVMAVK